MLFEIPFTTELHSLLVQCLPLLRRRTRQRLLWFILGILLAQSIVLHRIAVAQAQRGGGSPLAASHARRLRRCLNDPHLNWSDAYAPALRLLLRCPPHQAVYLLIDESGHTDQVRLLMAALWYEGRALPLAWVQRPCALPPEVSYWDLVRLLLDRVAQVLPSTWTVIVLADRAFGTPAFTRLVAQHGWHWVVRVQGQTCFRDRQGYQRRLRETVPQPGSRWKGTGEVFRKQGWQVASVVAFWDTSHREPLLVVSDLPRRWDLLTLYFKRGAIEGLFRDWKTGGWQWESSQVQAFAHREHLYLGMAWATLLCLQVGRAPAQAILERTRVPRGSRVRQTQDSWFQLGRHEVQRLLEQPAAAVSWGMRFHHTQSWEQQVVQRQRHARIFA